MNKGESSETWLDLRRELVQKLNPQEPVVFVFGAMAHGHVTKEKSPYVSATNVPILLALMGSVVDWWNHLSLAVPGTYFKFVVDPQPELIEKHYSWVEHKPSPD